MDAATRLGVPPDADVATIRAAFARRVRAVHPDTAGETPGAAAELAALIEARAALLRRAGRPVVTGPVVVFDDRGPLRRVSQWVFGRRRRPAGQRTLR